MSILQSEHPIGKAEDPPLALPFLTGEYPPPTSRLWEMDDRDIARLLTHPVRHPWPEERRERAMREERPYSDDDLYLGEP